jgi:Deoxynucleotide monophosphate kinase
MSKLIGICGLIGSGKDTVGEVLVNEYGYSKLSFAGTLKDMTAVLFDWDREMLEGTTPETRAEREILDPFWSEKLGRDWSPRIALQQMGTEVMRNHLHEDIWLLTLENKLRKHDKVVITDCRFPNEIDFVKEHGVIWTVDRGKKPDWWNNAVRFNYPVSQDSRRIMYDLEQTPEQLGVHASEYSWVGVTATEYINNNATLEELYRTVRNLV